MHNLNCSFPKIVFCVTGMFQRMMYLNNKYHIYSDIYIQMYVYVSKDTYTFKPLSCVVIQKSTKSYCYPHEYDTNTFK